MKKAGRSILFLLFLILVFGSCAKRGSPDGGPIDEEPPQFVRASPENFSINFDADEIELFFNEYIKLSDAQRQIIISPPMELQPAITPLGSPSRSIEIELFDTLQPNTTYTINFGTSIADNNEGNPLRYFQYVFSTGSYIDSLSVAGRVASAYSRFAEPFISVMLYEVDSSYTDSAVYKNPPRYITNTLDSLTAFQINNLKAGTYKLIALRDANNNYLYEPGRDKIGFIEETVTIPTDSTFVISLFNEEPEFTIAPRPEQVAQQHIIFAYEGEAKEDSMQIKMLSQKPAGFEHAIVKDIETDTLHYWFKPALEERDSLVFAVSTPNYKDTLISRITEMEPDSLQIDFEPTGTLNFNDEVTIIPTTPVVATEKNLIKLINKDSVAVPFNLVYQDFTNRFLLEFEKQENQTYIFEALPGAFTDFFGSSNDTLQAKFSTRTYADYGNVTINLQNVRQYPVIVQLTNEEGEVQAEKKLTEGNTVAFQHLDPQNYLLRVIIDENANGKWDTGNYLLGKQPEEIIYFPDLLDVRANWDIAQPFILP